MAMSTNSQNTPAAFLTFALLSFPWRELIPGQSLSHFRACSAWPLSLSSVFDPTESSWNFLLLASMTPTLSLFSPTPPAFCCWVVFLCPNWPLLGSIYIISLPVFQCSQWGGYWHFGWDNSLCATVFYTWMVSILGPYSLKPAVRSPVILPTNSVLAYFKMRFGETLPLK